MRPTLSKEERPGSRKKVFVVWDFQTHQAPFILQGLKRREPEGYELVVPGTGLDGGEVWRDVVEPGLRAADTVLVLVDLSNANVGFEAGFALGLGKRVILARVGTEIPDWIDRPPLRGQVVLDGGDEEKLRKLILEAKGIPSLPSCPLAGEALAILYPDNSWGKTIRPTIDELRVEHIRFEPEAWGLGDLPKKLATVSRLVWILVPNDPGTEGRDGVENAATSVTVGYALALEREVQFWKQTSQRVLLDIRHRDQAWESLDDLARLLKRLQRGPSAAGDVLRTYLDHLHELHAQLVPFFSGMADKTLGEVYVPLHIEDEKAMSRVGEMRAGEALQAWSPMTLEELLSLPIDPARHLTGRWLVEGDPGSGKSTMCRYLCFEAGAREDGPVPVFVSLARYAKENKHPFQMAEADLLATELGEHATGLAERLERLAKESERVWFLFDGLDEVPRERVSDVLGKLKRILEPLPRARAVVTTRPEAKIELGETFRSARLSALGPAAQRELLEKWLGAGQSADLQKLLDSRPTLRDLARNPLMLTILARLSLEPGGLPLRKAPVFEKAIRVLLETGHGKEPHPVRSPPAAERILPALALALHETGAESWTRDEVFDALVKLREREDLAAYFKEWENVAEFQADIARNSGLLAPQGSGNDPWRFLHKSFREFLAAKALLALGEEELLKRTAFLVEKPEEPPKSKGKKRRTDPVYPVEHWGETFALLCGLTTTSREPLLKRLHAVSPRILIRTLLQVEGLDPGETLDFLLSLDEDSWDGDDLVRLVEGWRLELHALERLRTALLERVGEKTSLSHLAYLYFALESLGPVDRRSFFEQCKRWPRQSFPEIPTVSVPPVGGALTFQMGSPEGEGHGNEHPLHVVRFSTAFRLGATTVTQDQFAAFEENPEAKKGIPAGVSWWEAWLFCRWLGGSLPTEAQWEFACRAGTTSPWSVPQQELKDVAWYGEGVSVSAHPVARKKPNAWGLFDMHGNVWEWCSDRLGSYSVGDQTDPSGPPTGSDRVLRGGAFWFDPVWCRSACRGWLHPRFRHFGVGFRVALSPPRAVDAR